MTGVPTEGGMMKPFRIDYVIELTRTKMLENIEFSTERVMERFPEFVGANDDKSQEVFKTLATLQNMKKHIKGFNYERNQDKEQRS
jgi:hypothetical protein